VSVEVQMYRLYRLTTALRNLGMAESPPSLSFQAYDKGPHVFLPICSISDNSPKHYGLASFGHQIRGVGADPLTGFVTDRQDNGYYWVRSMALAAIASAAYPVKELDLCSKAYWHGNSVYGFHEPWEYDIPPSSSNNHSRRCAS